MQRTTRILLCTVMSLLVSTPLTPAGQTFPVAAQSTNTSPTPTPLVRAYAHNDYLHPRPLFDALDHGFCSVEADVWLVDGKLLIAHERSQVKPENTLQSLYLEPLRERVTKNGGRVYQNGPEFALLIDVKSQAEPTYVALSYALRPYIGMLTIFRTNATETNAVTVIISGNRARATMAAETLRFVAYDGRLEDLDSAASVQFIPWISSAWAQSFKWRGRRPNARERACQIAADCRKGPSARSQGALLGNP